MVPPMSFGDALISLRSGQMVARHGWNGKGMFIYLVPANSYPATTPAAKQAFALKSSSVGPNNEIMVPYTEYIAIKSVNDTVTPWLPSQTDVLAEDWYIVL